MGFSTGCANAWLMRVFKKLPATEADVAEARTFVNLHDKSGFPP
jgi:hypothetical protein